MADWTDGPEYAPRVRPEVFTAPVATSIEAAPEPERPHLTDAPAVPPSYTGPAQAQPLDAVAAPVAPRRDPSEPFSVVSLTMTAEPSAPAEFPPAHPGPWEGVHSASAPRPASSHDPRLPIPPSGDTGAPHPSHAWPAPTATAGAAPAPVPPPPGGSGWPAPGGRPESGSAPPPATVAAVITAVTPGVLITLLVGGIVGAVSLPLLWVAQVLAVRIQHRRKAIQRIFVGAWLASILLGLVVSAAASAVTLDGVVGVSMALGQVACWVVLVTVIVVVADALHRGSRAGH